MANTLYVYATRAYREAAAMRHHARIRSRLSESLNTVGEKVKYVFRVDEPPFHKLVTDPVELYRLRRHHPDATVRVIAVED